jgi:CRP-like cAMP-binding protein
MALIDSSVRSATVKCRTDCVFIKIDQGQFDHLTKNDPGFARYIMRVMAERLRKMNERFRKAHSIELTRGGTEGAWYFGVYERETGGEKVLIDRFPTYELAVQQFPLARLTSAESLAAIPST